MKSMLTVSIVAMAMAAGAADAPRLLAHRGGAHEYDENTMGAFKACYEKGLRGFETDFRITKDDRIVILHDDTLNRTTDGTGQIENLTAEEASKFRTKKSGEPLPFVEDFVAFFKDKPDVFSELEMKTGNKTFYTEERLEVYCRALHEAASALPAGTYCFTSFDHRALRTMRRLYPDAPVGLIVGGALEEKHIALATELKARQIAPVMDVTTRKMVRAAQKAGFKLTGWPNANESDYALGVAMGYDYLTTDIPVRLHEKHK